MYLIIPCVKCGTKLRLSVHKKDKRFYIMADDHWIKISPDVVYIMCDECSPVGKGEVIDGACPKTEPKL